MILRALFLCPAALLAAYPAVADQVTVSGSTVYVTKSDCAQLVAHRPAPGVVYQPGVDVHGKYVAPADTGDNAIPGLVPGKVGFNVVVNPMNYGGLNTAQGASGIQGKYDNSGLPVARVVVDLATGETWVNGQRLSSEQDRIVREACRKAGY